VPGIEILAQILLDKGLGSLVLFELLQAVADRRGRQAQVAAATDRLPSSTTRTKTRMFSSSAIERTSAQHCSVRFEGPTVR
jgi:hypothetical protein